MPVEEDMVTRAFFKASVHWEACNGGRIKFWFDCWLQGQSISDLFPQLVAAVQPQHRLGHLPGSALVNDS
jgi:hypothetical protein